MQYCFHLHLTSNLDFTGWKLCGIWPEQGPIESVYNHLKYISCIPTLIPNSLGLLLLFIDYHQSGIRSHFISSHQMLWGSLFTQQAMRIHVQENYFNPPPSLTQGRVRFGVGQSQVGPGRPWFPLSITSATVANARHICSFKAGPGITLVAPYQCEF